MEYAFPHCSGSEADPGILTFAFQGLPEGCNDSPTSTVRKVINQMITIFRERYCLIVRYTKDVGTAAYAFSVSPDQCRPDGWEFAYVYFENCATDPESGVSYICLKNPAIAEGIAPEPLYVDAEWKPAFDRITTANVPSATVFATATGAILKISEMDFSAMPPPQCDTWHRSVPRRMCELFVASPAISGIIGEMLAVTAVPKVAELQAELHNLPFGTDGIWQYCAQHFEFLGNGNTGRVYAYGNNMAIKLSPKVSYKEFTKTAARQSEHRAANGTVFVPHSPPVYYAAENIVLQLMERGVMVSATTAGTAMEQLPFLVSQSIGLGTCAPDITRENMALFGPEQRLMFIDPDQMASDDDLWGFLAGTNRGIFTLHEDDYDDLDSAMQKHVDTLAADGRAGVYQMYFAAAVTAILLAVLDSGKPFPPNCLLYRRRFAGRLLDIERECTHSAADHFKDGMLEIARVWAGHLPVDAVSFITGWPESMLVAE